MRRVLRRCPEAQSKRVASRLTSEAACGSCRWLACAPSIGPVRFDPGSSKGARVTTSSAERIAEELGVRNEQVMAAMALLDGGAAVPFIARYRKEATGALDDGQLRTLEERLRYLRELEESLTAECH